jgi:hypothetical protein
MGENKYKDSEETGHNPSRTAEEWRAYHRDYYRKNAERRRIQAARYYQRQRLKRALARYRGLVPDRIIRLLFLRD